MAAAERAVDRHVGQRQAQLRDLAVGLTADERVAPDERVVGAEVGLAEVDLCADAVAAGVPEVGEVGTEVERYIPVERRAHDRVVTRDHRGLRAVQEDGDGEW